MTDYLLDTTQCVVQQVSTACSGDATLGRHACADIHQVAHEQKE